MIMAAADDHYRFVAGICMAGTVNRQDNEAHSLTRIYMDFLRFANQTFIKCDHCAFVINGEAAAAFVHILM